MFAGETSCRAEEELAEEYCAIAAQRFVAPSSYQLALSIAQLAVMMHMPLSSRSPRQRYRYRSVEEFVLREGVAFATKAPPRDVSMGETKRCFSNCFKRALLSRRYAYCEGIALAEQGFPPMRHAWLLDLTDGLAFDPTWRPSGVAYIGVVIDKAYLAAVFPTAGSVIDNYRARWPILAGTVGDTWRHRWMADQLAVTGVMPGAT